ncbi:DUF547 domain-containing protein [Rhabdaerophilum sp. SD176]|uniref:DUF547 domain-containing protein n=1 Tax=Rhabdaerophilum sp. SD176 TaxID=2983548 RepID=UPI0024DF788B|nr:DUF547 domain-containing protein [Rhabdaerophilum sp. SD176]
MTRHAFTLDRRHALGLGVALVLSPRTFAVAQTDPDAPYDGLLRRYVKPSPDGITRVDYAAWRANTADRAALDAYIAEMAQRRPSAMGRGDAMAYWGNLYNAITLKVIIDRYPVASIRDIKSDSWLDPKAYSGPWRQPRVTVEGRRLSLDDIEHAIMRPTFKDPRVHYIVNCASYGCPNLMNRAWRAATLEADLDAGARAFINHPRGVTILPSGALKVSSIYKWFIEDFGGNDAGLVAHFRAYAEPALKRHLSTSPRIAEDDYDWSLNRTRPIS